MLLICPRCKSNKSIPDTAKVGDQYICGRCDYVFTIQEDNYREAVFRKIDNWKKLLLDLTRRNRLIHFKPSRTSTIEIVSPSLKELFNRLVLDGHSLAFALPKRERQLIMEESNGTTLAQPTEAEITPGDLDTNVPVKEAQSILRRLRREWKTWQEEQGVQTLFLTVGMLRWYESETEQEESRAPIILIPVGLEKEGLEKPFKLHFVDEDILINPTLFHKIETDFDIQLPELPEDADWEQIDSILNRISKVVPKHWDVFEEIWLARFSFDKFAMYRDLEEQKERAASHPIICALSNAGNIPNPPGLPSLSDMDNLVNAKDVFPVLPADSNQQEALIRAREGQNLIIHGPPGTGKSQTIANLIAQLLREKKKVLFVSEKMAALEVVFKRLKEIGLSFACLEVHSHRSNKSRVIEELGKSLKERIDISIPADVESQFDRLIRKRELLNLYVKELHRKRGVQQISAYYAHGMLSKYINAPSLQFNLPNINPLEVSLVDQDDWISAIRGIAEIAEVWNQFEKYPWAGDIFDLDTLTLGRQETLLETIKALKPIFHNIRKLSEDVASTFSIPSPKKLKEVDDLIQVLSVLTECQPVIESWFSIGVQGLNNCYKLAQEAEDHSIRLFDSKGRLEKIFKDSLLALPVDEILDRFSNKYKSFFKRLKKQYQEDLRRLVAHSNPVIKLKYRTALEGLNFASDVLLERNWYKENESILANSLGIYYKGPASSWPTIISGIKWIDRLLQISPGARVPAKIISLCSQPETLKDSAEHYLRSLKNLKLSFSSYLETLRQFYKQLLIYGDDIQDAQIDVIENWLDARLDSASLDSWISYLRAKAACGKLGLEPFIDAAFSARIEANQLENAFHKRYLKSWISMVYSNSPSLNEFRGQRHEELIKEFQSLDKELQQVTIKLIQSQVQESQPKRFEARTQVSQVGILLKEVQKRKRHRSLRRLFAEIPELLQALKPCLLMSPLSVSAYIGKSNCIFDTVIFDEASQIPPEDAIGAILRGNQLIVAGDNKQLPPSRFFQSMVDYDLEDDQIDEMPLESILDECSWLPSGMVPSPLAWHYRSKHEELIAFSNQEFYDNKLVTFPSPFPKGATGAIQYVYVPDAVYDRGASRTNKLEAKRVIDLVCEHLLSGEEGSIGIITLNLQQEDAILQEWERRKTIERDIAGMIQEEGDEPFFVKALERVQGDERDYIFISIGFGPDKSGVVSMNFGPINREGGERRLNVAITRARKRTTLVCSLHPHELDLTKLTSGYKGVSELQKYLAYAKNNGVFIEEAKSTGIPESDFEYSVKEAIEASGYVVDAQVGFCRFRIDLGIRHPDIPNRYILGVECDGATYHSHRTARDRDRIRQDVLTKLGWNIHRIWSTDWIKDQEKALIGVLKRVNELRAGKDPGVGSGYTDPPDETQANEHRTKADHNETNKSTTKTADPQSRRFPFYRYYATEPKKAPERLYGVESVYYYKTELYQDILAIIKVEGPIHIEALCSRIRELYNLARAGSRIQDIVRNVLHTFKKEGVYIYDGEFILMSDCNIEPRIPRHGDKVRPIEWISINELSKAIECVIEDEIGISRQALIRSTAQLLGFERTGSNVQARISKAIDALLEAGKIQENENQITLKIP